MATFLALGLLVVCKGGFLSDEEKFFSDDLFSILESDGETMDGKDDQVDHTSKRGDSFFIRTSKCQPRLGLS